MYSATAPAKARSDRRHSGEHAFLPVYITRLFYCTRLLYVTTLLHDTTVPTETRAGRRHPGEHAFLPVATRRATRRIRQDVAGPTRYYYYNTILLYYHFTPLPFYSSTIVHSTLLYISSTGHLSRVRGGYIYYYTTIVLLHSCILFYSSTIL